MSTLLFQSSHCAGDILILTGTPGAGKTTAARRLVLHPGVPKVHLQADDFWNAIGTGLVPPYLPEAHVQNAVVARVLAAAAGGYASAGYFVIVDGIIGPWFLAPFRALSNPLHYAVLRPPLETALRRCRERGSGAIGADAIESLHAQLSALGELDRHAIEVDGMAPEEVAAALLEATESGRLRLQPSASIGPSASPRTESP